MQFDSVAVAGDAANAGLQGFRMGVDYTADFGSMF